MTHTCICFSDLTIIGSDNGLSPGRRQAIIRTNDGILLIRPLGTNFSEILIEILIFSFKKMHLKVSSTKRRPFCLGLNVLIYPCDMSDRLDVTSVNILKTDLHFWVLQYNLYCVEFFWGNKKCIPLSVICKDWDGASSWNCGKQGSTYRQVPYIRRTLVGNKIVDHSDVVGASPVGAAPTTSSFST